MLPMDPNRRSIIPYTSTYMFCNFEYCELQFGMQRYTTNHWSVVDVDVIKVRVTRSEATYTHMSPAAPRTNKPFKTRLTGGAVQYRLAVTSSIGNNKSFV